MNNAAVDNDTLNVKSVGKAFDVLFCFQQTSPSERELGLMDIVRLTGFDKSTAQRFIHTLHLNGFLVKNENTRRYSLGHKSLDLAYCFLKNNRYVEIANPHLVDLCRQSQCRVSLSLFDDTETIYAVRHHFKPEYYSSMLIGKRIPIVASSGGRAILALLDEERRNDILDRSQYVAITKNSTITKNAVLKEIRKVQEQGYAITIEQVAYGEIGIGVALTDSTAQPVAAIHLIGSLSDWEPEKFEKHFASLILATARKIAF